MIDKNADLKRLSDEGFDLEISGSFLIVNNVPYLDLDRKVQFGKIYAEMTLSGTKVATPRDHTAYFTGIPHDQHGNELTSLINSKGKRIHIDDQTYEVIYLSKKPIDSPEKRYRDHHHKITHYVELIERPVRAIGESAAARAKGITREQKDLMATERIFKYPDTNTTRSEIDEVSNKLRSHKIGIIGVGGTGSYILDYVAKTPVEEIHIFDGDYFENHNAFRAPGAPSVQTLNNKPKKVSYFQALYSEMRNNIHAHDEMIDETNIGKLRGLDFVFVSIDNRKTKWMIMEYLKSHTINFCDVGLGILCKDGKLLGLLRTTLATNEKNDHLDRFKTTSDQNDEEDVYSTNIQIAELNSLNAIMAVVMWKKLCGFYHDFDYEHSSTYQIETNAITRNHHRP